MQYITLTQYISRARSQLYHVRRGKTFHNRL